MNKEFEFYHGVVFSKLVHYQGKFNLSLKLYSDISNACYVINNRVGLYIKHSTKRITPWSFSIQKDHKQEFLQMAEDLKEVFLILVCGDDGIVTLRSGDLWTIINRGAQTEWISIIRTPRKEYTVKGPNGVLDHKVGKSDFPKIILS